MKTVWLACHEQQFYRHYKSKFWIKVELENSNFTWTEAMYIFGTNCCRVITKLLARQWTIIVFTNRLIKRDKLPKLCLDEVEIVWGFQLHLWRLFINKLVPIVGFDAIFVPIRKLGTYNQVRYFYAS